jgi:hypothetical protein
MVEVAKTRRLDMILILKKGGMNEKDEKASKKGWKKG